MPLARQQIGAVQAEKPGADHQPIEMRRAAPTGGVVRLHGHHHASPSTGAPESASRGRRGGDVTRARSARCELSGAGHADAPRCPRACGPGSRAPGAARRRGTRRTSGRRTRRRRRPAAAPPGVPAKIGNASAMNRLAAQFDAVATAAPRARIDTGNTSETSSQASGPAEIAKKAMKDRTAATVSAPFSAIAGNASPAPARSRLMAIPTRPMVSSGRRPNRWVRPMDATAAIGVHPAHRERRDLGAGRAVHPGDAEDVGGVVDHRTDPDQGVHQRHRDPDGERGAVALGRRSSTKRRLGRAADRLDDRASSGSTSSGGRMRCQRPACPVDLARAGPGTAGSAARAPRRRSAAGPARSRRRTSSARRRTA